MPTPKRFRRVLDPGDRIAEMLFGLIMALTFTGSLSVADSGRDDVRAMLVGALGCNLAWGLIDGIFHLLFRTADVGLDRALLLSLHPASDADEGASPTPCRPAWRRRWLPRRSNACDRVSVRVLPGVMPVAITIALGG